MPKITIDITSENQMQTLTYDAAEFELLNNTGVEDGHLKVARVQGSSAGVNLPKAWERDLVLCIRLKR